MIPLQDISECPILAGDLSTLNNSTWTVESVDKIREILNRELMGLDDEMLMEAFYDTFISDFKIRKVRSNTFEIDWVEYKSVKDAYKPLDEEKQYSGEEIVNYILHEYETPEHLCLVFNRALYKYGKVCFPMKGDKTRFVLSCGMF
jgi:hypothetical protein